MKSANFFKVIGSLFGGFFISVFMAALLDAGSFTLSAQDFDEVNGMFEDEDFEDLEEISDQLPESPEEITPMRRPTQINRPVVRPRPTSISGGRNAPGGASRGSLNFATDVPNPNEKLRMDFIQVEIEEIVKFFSERLKKQFIYDPSILQGQITIVSPNEVSVEEAWEAFLSAMKIRGYAVFPSGSYLEIDRVANARKAPVPLFLHSTPDDDSYVTRIINLRYLSVRDIRQAVRELVSRGGGDVIEHAPTNTLIISDYASNIRRIVRILNILDVEGFQEQIAVIQIQHASASEVARKISEIFPTGPSASGSSLSPAARARNIRTQSVTAAAGGDSVIQKVVADDRTNSLIVLGSERGIDQVKRFIEQIDLPIEGGDGQIHVYPLQNVKAEDLAQTLASLTQGTSPRNTAVSAGASPAAQAAARARAAAQGATSAGASSANLFDGEVRITADPRSNALIIMSSPRDFETLKGIIEKLDVRRRQVFIESVILEASVGGGSRFGTQVTGPLFRTEAFGGQPGQADSNEKSSAIGGIGALTEGTNLLGILNGLAGGAALQGLALGFRSGGTVGVPFTTADGETETRQVPLLSAIMQLSARSSNINVLSTPHILATANEEASISIGQEIPQVATSGADNAGNPVQSFNRIRVATELTITPQINAGNYLTLEIDQKVNEPTEPDSRGQISTVTREAKTTAIVQDGQTIVIGGIMRDRTEKVTQKVPFLGDIPILGWLFKSRSSNSSKVNLLLFITPHIIKDTGDMNDVFFRKISERNSFLKGIGISEMKNVPFAGYSQEDLKFLDEEYLESLVLTPLPEAPPTLPVEEKLDPSLEVAPPAPTPRREFPTIPVGPRSREPDMGPNPDLDDVPTIDQGIPQLEDQQIDSLPESPPNIPTELMDDWGPNDLNSPSWEDE
jgi:general secretion pathway protein D